jgi:hypothetical protein
MKKYILLIAALAGLNLAKAQTYDILGVKKINPNDINSIIENNEVKGY